MAGGISYKTIHVLRTTVVSSMFGVGVVLILSRANVQGDIQVCRNSDGTQMHNVLFSHIDLHTLRQAHVVTRLVAFCVEAHLIRHVTHPVSLASTAPRIMQLCLSGSALATQLTVLFAASFPELIFRTTTVAHAEVVPADLAWLGLFVFVQVVSVASLL